jgi:O-antigen ligase
MSDSVVINEKAKVQVPGQVEISDVLRQRLLLGFLVLLFLFGGSARADVASLALLRPIAAFSLVCLIALGWRNAWATARGPVLVLTSAMLLVLLHVIPLPPGIWTALPGRQVVVDTMAVTGITPGWMPLTLAPVEGWNQLFALTVPAAALLAMVWAGAAATRPVILLLLAVIMTSALLGLLQSIGPANSLLYFYRITNEGMGVGLFANRNHQAMLLACFFPLLAVWASTITGSAESQRAKTAVALGLGLAVLPLLFVTGSRSGLALAAVGIASAFVVFRRPKAGFRARGQEKTRRIVGFLVAVTMVIMVLVAALSTRSVALQRMVENDPADDLRFQALPTITDAIATFFPFGSGAGSFVQVYKLLEPDSLLGPAYFNHAHNDLAEIALEYGMFGIALMIAAAVLWGVGVIRLWKRRRAGADRPDRAQIYGWAGASILLILGLGSIVDYPLRVPSLAGFAAIASVWMTWALRPGAGSEAGNSQRAEYRLAADADKELQ